MPLCVRLLCFGTCNCPQCSCGKVMFSQVSVILFTGGVANTPRQTPPRQTPPTPTPGKTPQADTSRQTPLGRHPPDRHPLARHPTPGQTLPCPMHAGIHTPCPVHAEIHTPSPTQCMLGYTAPQQPLQWMVRILLECILVKLNILRTFVHFTGSVTTIFGHLYWVWFQRVDLKALTILKQSSSVSKQCKRFFHSYTCMATYLSSKTECFLRSCATT